MDAFRTLMEIQYLRGVLLESRLDFLWNKYVPLIRAFLDRRYSTGFSDYYDLLSRLSQFSPEDHHAASSSRLFFDTSPYAPRPPDDIIAGIAFNWIVSLDPNIHKKNAQWLLDGFISGAWVSEDGYKATDILAIYDRVKPMMPVEQRDIRHFKTIPALFSAVRPYMMKQSNRAIDRQVDVEMHKQAEIIYDGPEYKIVIPKTQEASCYFGIHTQWCTAAKNSDNAFESYARRGPLFIILDKKNNERWQFHFDSDQFMDETDAEIDKERFAKEHPKVLEILLPHILEQYELLPITFEGYGGHPKLVARGLLRKLSGWHLGVFDYKIFENIFYLNEPYFHIYTDAADNSLRSVIPYDILTRERARIVPFLNSLEIQGFSMRKTSLATAEILEWTGDKFVVNR